MSSFRAGAFRRRPVRSAFSLLGLGVLGFACVLVVTACGSSPNAASGTTTAAASTATTATGTTTTPAVSAGFAAYEKCIVAHGGTAFTGGRGGFGGFGRGAGTSTTSTTTAPASTGTTTRPSFTRPPVSAAEQKATTACASLRPAGGAGGFAGGGTTFTKSPAYAKFEQCLKSHGVTTTTGGFGRGAASSADRAALTACRSDLPAGSFAGPGGAGGAGGAGGTGGASSSSFAKLQQCLKAHGYTPGAAGVSQAKIASAVAACRSVANSGTTTSTTTSPTTTSG